MDCVFCKIREGEIEKDFTYQDDDVMVFPDINPVMPVHLLIMPKKHIKEFLELDDKELMYKVNSIVQKMIKEQGLNTKGYRIGINGGGAQQIDHFHMHLIGPMGRMAKL